MATSTVPVAPILRVSGRDATAREVLVQALTNPELRITGDLPERFDARPVHDALVPDTSSVFESRTVVGDSSDYDVPSALDFEPVDNYQVQSEPGAVDPYQVDLALAVTNAAGTSTGFVPVGSTYAGLTPPQRGAFLAWAQNAAFPAPPAFQRLLVAHIEVSLLETGGHDDQILDEMIRWSVTPPWRQNEWLARAMLLSLWLSSNGAGIAKWISLVDVPPSVLDLAIGMQTVLQEGLHAAQVGCLCQAWDISCTGLSTDTAALRLRSLTDTFGTEPLAFVYNQISPKDLRPIPWRTAHRDLRFSLPQPSIRHLLQPLLKELATNEQVTGKTVGTEVDESAPAAQHAWLLILEFGQSRSDFYSIVLELARRMPSYVQLLDEDRRLVHRVQFEKRDMRKFWRIWDYVQSWSTTRVYLNGHELEHWKVWPYSQYLR